ncbi:hypothetical protein AAVH_20308 [Aphelenchoides avenae]|nr:hypothetical protein AAVH_20308 [Aphelenchus avenae]
MSAVEVSVHAQVIENSSVTFERPYALRFTTEAPTANDLLKRICENEPFSDPKFQPPKLTTEHEHFGTVDVLGTEPLVHLRSYSIVFDAHQEVPAKEAPPNVSSVDDLTSTKNDKDDADGVVARIKALLPHDPRRALELAKQNSDAATRLMDSTFPKFFEAVLRELKNHPDLHFPAIEAFAQVLLALLGIDGKSHGEVLAKLALLLPTFIDISRLISVTGLQNAAAILLFSVILRLWGNRKVIAAFACRIAGIQHSIEDVKLPSSIAVGGSDDKNATRFLNALRGYNPGENGAARISVAMSKENVIVYNGFSDRVQFPFEAVFADIPGSESALATKDYFSDHNLQKYASLLIFVGSYVSDADACVAREARKHEIFAAFVHTDCDRELENMEEHEKVDTTDPTAVQDYLAKRRKYYIDNLKRTEAKRRGEEDLAKLPLFFVSARTVFALMTGASDEGILVLDELKLINAIRSQCTTGDDATP